MTDLTPKEKIIVQDLETEDPSIKRLLQSRVTGITGDRDADWFILQKVAEDRRRPPTNIPNKPKRDPIVRFRGAYRFLSNFQECDIYALGHKFSTTEAAYHAAKRLGDVDFIEEISRMGPKDAMHYGRSLPVTTPMWHEYVKLDVMKSLTEQKFSQHEWLRFSLLGTGDAHLEEANTHGDSFWGTDLNDPLHPLVSEIEGTIYNGQNNLGKILMEVRRMLKVGML